MNSVALAPQYVALINDILRRYVPQSAIYLFGSRAKNTARKFSDVDLAIDNQSPISPAALARLKNDLAESSLPYKVDVVDLNDLSAEFHAMIKNDLVLLADLGAEFVEKVN